MQNSIKKVIIITAIIIAVVIAGATIAVGLLLKGNDKPVSSDNPPAVTDVTTSGDDVSDMTSGENTVPDTTTENGNNNAPSSSETQGTENTPSPESVTKSGLSAGAKLVSSWDNNGQINSQFDITVSNNGSENVSSWTVEFDVPAGSTLSGSWNGNYSIAGTVLKITGDQNNSNISAGGTSTTGFIIVSPSAFDIKEIRVNGEKVKVDVSSG
ncbi:MAG: cellulose binding domain-containing protein, partial [Oscillospiraceae bacterium]|nr:cellulose binding domain-containing protein [Oscillospiraceae bacterium]